MRSGLKFTISLIVSSIEEGRFEKIKSTIEILYSTMNNEELYAENVKNKSLLFILHDMVLNMDMKGYLVEKSGWV